ncbi:MAG: hypothetical protein CBB87_00435 [Micavibrio sp. TMED27]|nr:transcriptional regulator [Micavibrio sp.]OUT92941.1 MAG: hypothetical protein CBB87_00435 [Micavibrio sp. TMED27]|tara:strand:+ start:5752 stop:6153 length:402 start_codon:yes stop_codon:yes gene_type:complete
MKNKKSIVSSVDFHIARRLKTKRKLLGLSQDKLAEKLDLTFQQIQKYENAKNRIAAGRLYEISKILNVPISYFYEGIEEIEDVKEDNPENPDMLYQTETLNLIRAYYSIRNSGIRASIKEFLKAVVENGKSKN